MWAGIRSLEGRVFVSSAGGGSEKFLAKSLGLDKVLNPLGLAGVSFVLPADSRFRPLRSDRAVVVQLGHLALQSGSAVQPVEPAEVGGSATRARA